MTARVALGRVLVVALVLWSWVPVVELGLAFARPIIPVIGGDAIYTIDRHGSDDSRVSSARKSDFRVGDHFAASALPLDGRLLLYGYTQARSSDRLALAVLRDGKRRIVTLRPCPYPLFGGMRPIDIALETLTTILSALTMTAAGALALLRSSVLARSLFLALFGLLIGEVAPYGIVPSGLAVFLVVTCGWGFVPYCSWQSVRAATLFPDGMPGPRSRSRCATMRRCRRIVSNCVRC